MALISLSDGALFAERFGTGPPDVLALHGWGRRGADFAASLGKMDVVALDLPGFGASPPPQRGMGAHGYAGLIGPVFELFDRPPVVVGHSFGGRIAVARQHHFPGSAAGLVLTGSPLLRGQGQRRRRPPVAFRVARAANRLGLLSDERMEVERRKRGSADYRSATGVMRDVLVTAVNESYETELAGIDVPVHLLWGETDSEVPVAIALAAAKILETAGVEAVIEVLDGVGHHVPLQAPEVLARAAYDMVQKVTR